LPGRPYLFWRRPLENVDCRVSPANGIFLGRSVGKSSMSEIKTIAQAAEGDDPRSRPQIALLPGFHRRAEGGHPWVYSNEVTMDAAAKALAPGTLVTLRRPPSTGQGERPFGV